MDNRKSRIWYVTGVLLLILISAGMLVMIVDRLAPIDDLQSETERARNG